MNTGEQMKYNALKTKLMVGILKLSYYTKLKLPYMTNLNVILCENWNLEHVHNNSGF